MRHENFSLRLRKPEPSLKGEWPILTAEPLPVPLLLYGPDRRENFYPADAHSPGAATETPRFNLRYRSRKIQI